MSTLLSEEQRIALKAVIAEMDELNDEEKTRLLSMVAMLMPAVRDANVGALIATATPAANGYIGLGLSTYNMNEVQVVSVLEAAAAMVQRRADRPLGEMPETLQ